MPRPAHHLMPQAREAVAHEQEGQDTDYEVAEELFNAHQSPMFRTINAINTMNEANSEANTSSTGLAIRLLRTVAKLIACDNTSRQTKKRLGWNLVQYEAVASRYTEQDGE